MDRAEKVTEALERMRILKIIPEAIIAFARNQTLNASEGGGFLYWLSDKDKESVRKFEEDYNALVYHVIKNSTEFGELLTFLYVSNYKDEWPLDREDLKNGNPLVYVVNLSDDNLSEFGFVSITPRYGGLVRVA